MNFPYISPVFRMDDFTYRSTVPVAYFTIVISLKAS